MAHVAELSNLVAELRSPFCPGFSAQHFRFLTRVAGVYPEAVVTHGSGYSKHHSDDDHDDDEDGFSIFFSVI